MNNIYGAGGVVLEKTGIEIENICAYLDIGTLLARIKL
jgi:hypothetical protein